MVSETRSWPNSAFKVDVTCSRQNEEFSLSGIVGANAFACIFTNRALKKGHPAK